MARRVEKTVADRIFENILFLEEVFGDKDDADIPDVPVLELAKCFEVSRPKTLGAYRGHRKSSQHGHRAGETTESPESSPPSTRQSKAQ